MRDIEKEVANRFAKDVAQHVMTIEADNGVHRCLRFARPGSGAYAFRLVTWPGHLYVGGDCDDFVFARLTDMFEFFRSDHGRINLGYWAEKLTAADKNGGYHKFDADTFRAVIVHGYRSWLRSYGDEMADADERRWVRSRIRDEVLAFADGNDVEAYNAASGFKVGGRYVFPDFWDNDLREYTYGFVWACYAIVWGIAQYDAAKAAPALELSHA
jgi:hypothetical protein